MPVLYNNKRLTGKVAYIMPFMINSHFTISTEKEGLFKGLSTMIWEGGPRNAIPLILIKYADWTRKADRLWCHDLLVQNLDEAGENVSDFDVAFEKAVDTVRATAEKERHEQDLIERVIDYRPILEQVVEGKITIDHAREQINRLRSEK
ncbi:MAG: hypothetical protein FVQ79_12600 [Planctomycetes bacterium]|nr:hypothetical protein [Planctomycetota bacterium]